MSYVGMMETLNSLSNKTFRIRATELLDYVSDLLKVSRIALLIIRVTFWSMDNYMGYLFYPSYPPSR